MVRKWSHQAGKIWGSSWRDVKNIIRYISTHIWKPVAFRVAIMYRQIEPDFRTIRIHVARVSVEEGNSCDGGRRISLKISDKCRCARPTRKLTRKSNIPSSKYGKSHIPRYRRKCNYRPMHLNVFAIRKRKCNEK